MECWGCCFPRNVSDRVWVFRCFLYISVKTTQSFVMAGLGRNILSLWFIHVIFTPILLRTSSSIHHKGLKKINQRRLFKTTTPSIHDIFFIENCRRPPTTGNDLISFAFSNLQSIFVWSFQTLPQLQWLGICFMWKFRFSKNSLTWTVTV